MGARIVRAPIVSGSSIGIIPEPPKAFSEELPSRFLEEDREDHDSRDDPDDSEQVGIHGPSWWVARRLFRLNQLSFTMSMC